jgi:hypothetical protein
MDLIMQREHYKELLDGRTNVRDVKADAPEAEQVEEKVYQ